MKYKIALEPSENEDGVKCFYWYFVKKSYIVDPNFSMMMRIGPIDFLRKNGYASWYSEYGKCFPTDYEKDYFFENYIILKFLYANKLKQNLLELKDKELTDKSDKDRQNSIRAIESILKQFSENEINKLSGTQMSFLMAREMQKILKEDNHI